MHLDPFELHRPTTVDEAVALARDLAGRCDYLAGGTDLLPNYKMHLNLRPHLIALEDIPELAGRWSSNGSRCMEALRPPSRRGPLAGGSPAPERRGPG